MGDVNAEPLPRLLLVEDDARLAPIMTDYLSDEYAVTHLADGTAGLRAALDGSFDVMIVDRRLPGTDGIDLVASVRRAKIPTPILLLTALGTVPDKVVGLDAGANDYLVKPFEFDELMARLRALRRTFEQAEPQISIGSWDYYPGSRCLYSPYGSPVVLTPKENELLTLLAGQPHRTFSRPQIISSVFADADQPGAVDTYVHYLRRKTDPEIIVTVRGLGYRLGTL
ncbi:response regulator transcription factor [Promicromonospora sukumoe]|uniref:Two-component system response regulator QseB n=1 Tax=Promicromonospora sukumoe TaxID=88382 RepID=A0A7W3PDR7_9MICO|nr:response regulator transcription factor [Promicromonospora sukumoe]MBA8807837.1 two-component system response regulator QseB [Promicromonospora sukumoe]